MKPRLLVDLNVILDVLLDRAPHADAAAALWATIEAGEAEGFIAAHSVTTLHYLARRAGGGAFADRCVGDLLSVFSVALVDEAVVRSALLLAWPDFEDAVSAAAAQAATCSVIVTRDHRFGASVVPAMAPGAALALIQLAGRG